MVIVVLGSVARNCASACSFSFGFKTLTRSFMDVLEMDCWQDNRILTMNCDLGSDLLREGGQGVGSRKIIDYLQSIPSWHPALQDLNSRKLPTGQVWIVLCYRWYCFTLGQRLGKDLFYEPTYSLQLGSRDLVKTMLRSSPRCWELIFKGGCLTSKDL